MQGRELRERVAITVDFVGVVGLSAFLLGLTWLRASEELGFDPAKALDGVLAQLPVTLPAALLVLGATALELGAGLLIARLARRTPFDSIAEAALAAMAAAVLKDTLLLGALAGFGLFTQPVLLLVDVVVIAALVIVPRGRRLGWPIMEPGVTRPTVERLGSITLAALVAVVWVGPLVLQLASPVVPFIDVLPNHVAPVEHLRTFGWFSPLDATQSPIHGPSRTVLGYDALLGSVATLTDLPAGLAIAAFAVVMTLLLAAGGHRLADVLRRGGAPLGPWALLAVALSQPFARLADVRGTVVVVPLVCLGLAVAAEVLRRPAVDDWRDRTAGDRGPERPPADPWRIGRGVVAGAVLGAAILVHPVMGFLAVVTLAVAALARPTQLAPTALVAGVTAGLLALPQAATTVGVSLPTLTLAAWVALAIAAGAVLSRALDRPSGLAGAVVGFTGVARLAVPGLAVVVVAAGFALGGLRADRLDDAVEATAKVILESSGLLLVVLLAGLALRLRSPRSPFVLGGLGIGVAAVALVSLLPDDLGFLGATLRFEVPKTIHYWLSTLAAVGAAGVLAQLAQVDRLPLLARGGALAAFVAVAALPLRPAPIDSYHLGEHRWSETFAIDLRYAGSGFWVGYPDSRTVVDEPQQELLEAIRAEIDAGRIRHDTPVLHVARTFQQWASTPLGVFAGVEETSISLDPEFSQHTQGGRILGSKEPLELMAIVDRAVADATYPYVVIEWDGLPEDLRALLEPTLAGAGYERIFANDQREVYARP